MLMLNNMKTRPVKTGLKLLALLYNISTKLRGLLVFMGQLHRLNSELEDQQFAPRT